MAVQDQLHHVQQIYAAGMPLLQCGWGRNPLAPTFAQKLDAAVLAHLSSVRSRLLDMRYRGIFH